MKRPVLVEWMFEGQFRHQVCESEASLTCCLHVLMSLPRDQVSDVLVYTPEVIASLNAIGMAGHA